MSLDSIEIKYSNMINLVSEMLGEVSDINIRDRKKKNLADDVFEISGNFRLNQLYGELHEISVSDESIKLVEKNIDFINQSQKLKSRLIDNNFYLAQKSIEQQLLLEYVNEHMTSNPIMAMRKVRDYVTKIKLQNN